MKRTPEEVLKCILQVQTGLLTVTEAARRLGLSRKTYYEKEARFLQVALASVTPQAPGRPATAAPTEAERLRSENNQLRQQLEALELRIQFKESLARAETRAEKKQGAHHGGPTGSARAGAVGLVGAESNPGPRPAAFQRPALGPAPARRCPATLYSAAAPCGVQRALGRHHGAAARCVSQRRCARPLADLPHAALAAAL